MENIRIDFSKIDGKIKNMNCVNNGPIKNVRCVDNFDAYKAAKIPYARIHDAAFDSRFGGEFTVDVHRIFRNFDNDENDPASYSFSSTDDYLKTIESAGAKVFYRLGATIEHYEKYGTFPPKDNLKWAKICEHIIRHYTEGWANGYHMDIEYWEIWNEPDCGNADGSNPCWQGTEEEFVEFFTVAYKYLKEKFPHLKIGGPAICYFPGCPEFMEKLFTRLNEEGLKLDFFSYHCYARDISWLVTMMNYAKALIDKYNQGDAELILNEWNYVKGWLGEDWLYTINVEKGLKGASFMTGAMCAGQKNPLDMLMYYDARPCGMNGMFNTDTFSPLKGYYPIAYFSKLAELGSYVKDECTSEDIHVCTATNGSDCAVLLTHYNDNDLTDKKEVTIDFTNAPMHSVVEVYVLDEKNDMASCQKASFNSSDFSITLDMPLFTTYYISIKSI